MKEEIEINGVMQRPEAVIPKYDRDPDDATPVAWGYGRVSTLDQDGDCSPQRTAIEMANKMMYDPKGFRFGGMFIDPATSGSKELAKRPAGGMLLKLIKPGDVVIVGKMDRFGRSLVDVASNLELFEKIGVQLHACDLGVTNSTDAGRLVMGIMALLAEWERERMSTRRMEQIAACRANGFAVGGTVPIGFKSVEAHKIGNRTFCVNVPYLPEQLLLERCWTWNVEHLISGVNIARHLQKYKHPFLRNTKPISERSGGVRTWDQKVVAKYVGAWDEMALTENDMISAMTPEELQLARAKQNQGLTLIPFGRPMHSSRVRKSSAALRNIAGQNLERLATRINDSLARSAASTAAAD